MAKATNNKKAADAADGTTAFDRVKTFVEKGLGHGLVTTEEEKKSLEADLDEIEGQLSVNVK